MNARTLVLILLVLGTAHPIHSWEGTTDALKVVGFSSDGRYLAYQLLTTGTDPTGVAVPPTAAFYILDVPANDFIIYSRQDTASAGTDIGELQTLNLRNNQASLDEYGIVPGAVGEYTFLARNATIHDDRHSEAVVQTSSGDNFVLKLEQRDASVDADGPCGAYLDIIRRNPGLYNSPRLFTLSLEADGMEQNLQEDSVLYRFRGCVGSYSLYGVYVLGDSIVVFIRASADLDTRVTLLVVGGIVP